MPGPRSSGWPCVLDRRAVPRRSARRRPRRSRPGSSGRVLRGVPALGSPPRTAAAADRRVAARLAGRRAPSRPPRRSSGSARTASGSPATGPALAQAAGFALAALAVVPSSPAATSCASASACSCSWTARCWSASPSAGRPAPLEQLVDGGPRRRRWAARSRSWPVGRPGRRRRLRARAAAGGHAASRAADARSRRPAVTLVAVPRRSPSAATGLGAPRQPLGRARVGHRRAGRPRRWRWSRPSRSTRRAGRRSAARSWPPRVPAALPGPRLELVGLGLAVVGAGDRLAPRCARP